MNVSRFTCDGNHKTLEEKKKCPVCSKKQVFFNLSSKFNSDHIEGSSPSVFVGKANYPNVQLGFMSLVEKNDNASYYDDPKSWAEDLLDNAKVLSLRSSLIYSHFTSGVNENSRYVELAKEVAMAKRHVDLEIDYMQKPQIRYDFDKVDTIMGPRAKIAKVKEEENPKIPLHIDKVYSAEDMKANEAISYLLKHNYDENHISKILSVGVLGEKRSRKIVPTRWSITATDDIFGKLHLEKIRDFSSSNYLSFFGNYMGNYYLILFLSGKWSYELFECSLSDNENVDFVSDYEEFNGRKNYAHNTIGGYYTVRLAILEKMLKLKRQSSVFVLRIITPEYKVPLGVWVTREASRKALMENPIEFSDISLMKDYMKKLVKKKFGFSITNIIKESKLLNHKQTSLGDF